jgi:hypothetical protein
MILYRMQPGYVDDRHAGNYVIFYDTETLKTIHQEWVATLDEKITNAFCIAKLAQLNNSKCECGASACGIEPFSHGHSDWCVLYRSPYVIWN